MNQLLNQIKKIFQNKLFLNIMGYFLAFTIGLLLAVYTYQKQETSNTPKENQTKAEKNAKADEAIEKSEFEMEKLDDKIFFVRNLDSTILSDKYILKQDTNYQDIIFNNYQDFSKNKKNINQLTIYQVEQPSQVYKDYNLVQLAQNFNIHAIPRKVDNQLFQDPQNGQFYFSFDVYIPDAKEDNSTKLRKTGDIYTLYTNIENGQTYYLENYFTPYKISATKPIYIATTLDKKLDDYGIVLANHPDNYTLIQGSDSLNIKSLKLSKEFKNVEKKLSEGWSLVFFGSDSYQKCIQLLASDGETDLYTNVKLDQYYAKDHKNHILQDYQDFLNLYQDKK